MRPAKVLAHWIALSEELADEGLVGDRDGWIQGIGAGILRREAPTETEALADRCEIARAHADRSHIALAV